MTDPIRDFPNMERLLAGVYAPLLGGTDHVGSQTPEDLEVHLPFLRIVRTGGFRTHLMDFPTMDLDYFEADELTGAPGASAVANRLLGKPPPHPSIDRVYCDPMFRELPWGDSDTVRRWGATFFLETRMVRVA